MALCSYSSKLAMDGYQVIDNTFFNEFLPQATGDDVKVYLYGLSLCTNPNIEDNSLDTISKVLSITEENVKKSFAYWQEVGLVQVVSTDPYEVRFLPIKAHSGSVKIRNKEKYSDFNKQMQEVISGRMITPVEFNEYYSLIEVYHFEPDALVLIARYCTEIKTSSIGYPYILAVARSFANDGIKTCDAVEKKFLEQEQSSKEIKQILDAMGLKREADLDERNMYLKWTNSYGFAHGTVLAIAKTLKKHGGFAKLDEVLTKYFEQKIISMEEIVAYSSKQDEMFNLAKEICKNLGLYYQTFDNVVDTYICDWTNKGYEYETLLFLSNYCFRQSIRTLDGMNVVIQKFYKLGLISKDSLEQYYAQVIKADDDIKQIIESVGLIKGVSLYDREYFKTWTGTWNFTLDQILIVTKSAVGKSNPMSYLNKVLGEIFAKGLKTDSEIKTFIKGSQKSVNKADVKENFESRTYSKEELSAVFDSLEDIEI